MKKCALWILSLLCLIAQCSCAATDERYPLPEPGVFAPQDDAAWQAFVGASEVLLDAGALMTDDATGVQVFVKSEPDEGWRPTDESNDCARTYVTYYDAEPTRLQKLHIEVYWPLPEPGCYSDMKFTLAHEMIHAARATAGISYLGMPDDHSPDGIFKAMAGSTAVEGTTKQKLCEAVHCDN